MNMKIVFIVCLGVVSAATAMAVADLINMLILVLFAILAGWYDGEEYSCED